MGTTIRDIAREAGVSIFTVSSVLHKRSHVREETRDKVLAVIDKLGYDPLNNIPLARRKRTDVLGMILPDQSFNMYDPFFSQAVMIFKTVCSEIGFKAMVFSASDIKGILDKGSHRKRETLPVDGVVLFCPFDDWDDYLFTLKDWDVPAVLVRRRTEVPGVPVIFNDDYRGTRMMMDHLFELGHTRIAYVDYPDDQSFRRDRRRAYEDMLKIKDIGVDDSIIFEGWQDTNTADAKHWLDSVSGAGDAPTAYFCFNDQSAMFFLRELERRGVKIPDEVAVCGFDGSPAAALFQPSITTMAQPVKKIIQHACGLLQNAAGGAELDQINIEVANELMVRESTEKK